ncbi:MAG: prolipoprotein diacylglyceryl transferase family protein, partial [Chitinophagaceae bacterium]
MRIFLITILIALIPISSLFIVNETVRNQNKPSGSLFNGAKRINGGLKLKHKCTWACHEGFEVIHCRKNHIIFLSFPDILAIVAPIGLFLGRIANFINAELYGRPTNVPWSVIFPYSDSLPRHPSQLYEAFLEGLVLFCIMLHFAYK